MLCLKIVDMYLKWSLLRGAAKSEDCPAAQEAWKKTSGTVGNGAGDSDDAGAGDADTNDGNSSLEMGTLHARPGAAGNSMSASVRDSNNGSRLTVNPMHHVTPTIAARSGGRKSKQEQRGGGGGGGGGSLEVDDIPQSISDSINNDSNVNGNQSGMELRLDVMESSFINQLDAMQQQLSQMKAAAAAAAAAANAAANAANAAGQVTINSSSSSSR
jgi:hypothetical protein